MLYWKSEVPLISTAKIIDYAISNALLNLNLGYLYIHKENFARVEHWHVTGRREIIEILFLSIYDKRFSRSVSHSFQYL